MTTQPHPNRPTRVDYFFRALVVLGVIFYGFAIYDNLVHGFSSISTYSYFIHLYALFVLTPSVLLVSALIIWRAPGNNVGRYLLLLGLGSLGWQFSYSVGSPQFSILLKALFYLYWFGLAFPSIIYLMLSFPTGHIFPTSWMPWVILFAVIKFVGVALELATLSPGDPFALLIFGTQTNLFSQAVLRPFAAPIASTIGSNGLLFLFGVVAGIASLVLRYRASASRERQQIKWVVWSFALLTLTLVVVVLTSATGVVANVTEVDLSGVLFLTALLTVFISIGISILRYRLFDIDLIINRTLVYLPLTAILAGLFAATISISQRFFVSATGQTSDAAVAFTTLLIVAVFDPIKKRLETFVEKRFKEAPDPIKKLRYYGDQVRAVSEVLDASANTQRLLNEAASAFDARGGAIYLNQDGQLQLTHAIGEWTGDAKVNVPLQANGTPLGELRLAARRNGSEYSDAECVVLRQTTDAVAHALSLAGRGNGIMRL